jgi:tetratricopeptide (TPR) repeat protein
MSSDQELPPPIPPAEMPEEELVRIVDEGNVRELERALREQAVRLPSVLEQLDRVLAKGLGNLATSIATMLIARFHVARADTLAERVLQHRQTAGGDELVDLGAALMQQERLRSARSAIDAALERDPANGRAIYLSARLAARKGELDRAFELIAKVDPQLLGGAGLATQARYAALTGKAKAVSGALKQALKRATEEERPHVAHVERLIKRVDLAAIDLSKPMSLRTAMALEYGSLLVELAAAPEDGGRFGMDRIKFGDLGPLIDRMIGAVRELGVPFSELCFANEDGEIVAAAIAQRTGLPVNEWRHDREVVDGAWLCMASAGTHPHQSRIDVDALQHALDAGTLRTLSLVLPVGWRAPLVPDVIGRLTGDDELPWTIDDEVEEMVELIFDDREAADHDAAVDAEALRNHVERFGGLLRAAQPIPRPPHVPFLDETPVARRQTA